jgi:hypothetical protein
LNILELGEIPAASLHENRNFRQTALLSTDLSARLDTDPFGSDIIRGPEFTGKDANGRQVEVDVLGDGKILEIEHEIGQDELPQAVLDATKPYLPDFQPKFIERSIRTGEPVSIYYELEGAGPDGKEVDVEVYESGGLVTIQQDMGF